MYPVNSFPELNYRIAIFQDFGAKGDKRSTGVGFGGGGELMLFSAWRDFGIIQAFGHHFHVLLEVKFPGCQLC